MRAREPFRNATPAQITAALKAALATLAPGAIVRVGDELHGLRNIGVDVPRAPRGEVPSVYERGLHRALEAAGVTMAPHHLGPAVAGRIRGSVRVGEAPPLRPGLQGDSAHLGPGPTTAIRPPPPTVPLGAVRDALGLVRLLYTVEREDCDEEREAALRQIGKALATVGAKPRHPDARALAVAALEHLEDLDLDGSVRALVTVAAERVRGAPREYVTEREAKRQARALRG